MRGFDAEDVEVIRKAVESGGVDAKACAPGPPMDERPDDDQPEEDSGLIPQIDRPMSMPYLCCKLWRWKDLQVDAALHRLEALPWCRFGRVTINNATVSCCNPYHYALWIRPETSSSDEDSLRDSCQREVPMGNGHIAYSRSHVVTPDIDLSLHLPQALAADLPTNPPPSVPITPPEPDSSPPGTSTSSPDPIMIHNHAADFGACAVHVHLLMTIRQSVFGAGNTAVLCFRSRTRRLPFRVVVPELRALYFSSVDLRFRLILRLGALLVLYDFPEPPEAAAPSLAIRD
ncbi:MH1 domain protein [Necator americanus]|uniref:MH1 domain protein n=1 Tax=Necator americanus TaxID=51031 RepID=W2TWQ9_NECAM|nr:MH1 domain protein [Necator americanus]ETN86515.1 MH1 domain protein [Necator americanus]